MDLLHTLRARLGSPRDSEREQALIRLVIGLLASGSVAIIAATRGQADIAQWAVLCGVVFLALSLIVFWSTTLYPAPSSWRRVAALVLDMGMLTYVLSQLGEYGPMLTPIYLWVTVGNGLRYGIRYLVIALALSVVGMAAVLLVNDYWQQRPYMSAGWVVGLVALPLYFGALLQRLRAKTDELAGMYEHFARLAGQDALTGLPNRVAFRERLADLLKQAERAGGTFAVAFVDLDGFKEVNDRHGHDVGDDIIRRAAARLSQTVRGNDFVARLGGDEFVVLLVDQTTDSIERVAQNIVAAMNEPYRNEHHTVNLSASVGVALYPEDGEELSTLLRHADQAMYRIKNQGKNGYHIRALRA
jgi:diguanylate cyclase (GGDEF)-like protein